jgi:hypothetical protein
MGRPSKLSPDQWAEIEKRIAGGEVLRDLAAEFGVSPAAISRKGFTQQSKRVQEVAQKLAVAQSELAALPVHQQHTAVTLAEKLRNISDNLASAAQHGAATAHRLNALANSEVAKVDDAKPMDSLENLRNVGVLTKLANDSANIALNLLAANKDRMKAIEEPEDDPDKPRGVLVVPGLMADSQTWAQAAQKGSVTPGGGDSAA